MNKRTLWFISVMMTIALIGVFVMQWYNISQAYNLRSQIFTQNVNKALNAVAEQVQRRNAVSHIEKKTIEKEAQQESNIRGQTEKIVNFRETFKQNDDVRRLRQQQMMFEYLNSQDLNIKRSYITPIIITEGEFQTYNNSDADIIDGLKLSIFSGRNDAGKLERRLITTIPRPNIQWLLLNGKVPDTVRYIALSPEDQLPRLISLPATDRDLLAKFEIEDANSKQKFKLELDRLYADTVVISPADKSFLEDVQKEMQLADVPLQKRITKGTLEILLKRELINQGVNTAFNFWVTMARKDSLIFTSARFDREELLPQNTHKVLLFNKDVIRDPGLLYVNFPTQRTAVFTEMGITLGSSLGFLLLLVFIFSYTIWSIIRQKKIAEMKTDFINNMTHEFKTPVATIMLASEALKDPDVQEDKTRIGRLAGIIYDENVRLGSHIERVLSIARIENKELTLQAEDVDLHDTIAAVADSMSLQLQKRNATVLLELNAKNSMLFTDELHLSNVLFNLIDNANKYSREDPVITIATRNSGNSLILEVADKGIGMTKEQTKRVFDQFYRVPTGNLHDVKGFGLGLNYVQDIVTEMNGTIKVHSEKDKGTVFEIRFPLQTDRV